MRIILYCVSILMLFNISANAEFKPFIGANMNSVKENATLEQSGGEVSDANTEFGLELGLFYYTPKNVFMGARINLQTQHDLTDYDIKFITFDGLKYGGDLLVGAKFNKFAVYGFAGITGVRVGNSYFTSSTAFDRKSFWQNQTGFGLGVEYNVFKNLALLAEYSYFFGKQDISGDFNTNITIKSKTQTAKIGLRYYFNL